MYRELISVPITSHNTPPELLYRCLRGIDRQTEKDVVVYLYLDGADDTLTTASEEIMRRRGWHIYQDGENCGVGERLNFLHAQCKGHFIAWHSAHDTSHPDRFRMQHKFLEAHDRVLCVSSRYESEGFDGRVTNVIPSFDAKSIRRKICKGVRAVPTQGRMMRKNLLGIKLLTRRDLAPFLYSKENPRLLSLGEDVYWEFLVENRYPLCFANINIPLVRHKRLVDSRYAQYQEKVGAGLMPNWKSVQELLLLAAKEAAHTFVGDYDKKLEELRNRYVGRKFLILASGPSLLERKEELLRLRDSPNRPIVIGVNRAGLIYPDCDYYAVMDSGLYTEQNHGDRGITGFSELFVGNEHKMFVCERQGWPDGDFIRCSPKGQRGFSFDLRSGYYKGFTTVALALQAAYFMGGREVYIGGLDLAHAKGMTHFFGTSDWNKRNDAGLFRAMQGSFEKIAKLTKEKMCVYNLNRDSAVRCFDFANWGDIYE